MRGVKMKKLVVVLVVSFCVVGLTGVGLAQTANHNVTITIGDIGVIGLNNTTAVALSITAPGTPGADPTGSSDNGKRLQYTSTVNGTQRTVTAVLDAGAPNGTQLTLEAQSVPAGAGTSGGIKTLSTSAETIISAIGSCATGTGANGAILNYVLSVSDVSQLAHNGAGATVTVTFTISDDT